MPHAARIDWDRAISIFEAPIDPDSFKRTPPPPHVLEGYVHEVWDDIDTPAELDNKEFIAWWMAWKAQRHGFGYEVLDESKPLQAAIFVHYARMNGLIATRGHGATRRLWLASKRKLYERDASGGRLVIPRPGRGAPRRSVLERHAEVARPVIEGLLRQVIEHPSSTGEIPSYWICGPRVPKALRGRTIAEGFDIIAGLHEGMSLLQGHIRWMWALRSELMDLGTSPSLCLPPKTWPSSGAWHRERVGTCPAYQTHWVIMRVSIPARPRGCVHKHLHGCQPRLGRDPSVRFEDGVDARQSGSIEHSSIADADTLPAIR